MMAIFSSLPALFSSATHCAVVVGLMYGPANFKAASRYWALLLRAASIKVDVHLAPCISTNNFKAAVWVCTWLAKSALVDSVLAKRVAVTAFFLPRLAIYNR